MATEDREENLRVSGHDWPEEFAAHSAAAKPPESKQCCLRRHDYYDVDPPDFSEIENPGQKTLQD
jgi:hypothetical protein